MLASAGKNIINDENYDNIRTGTDFDWSATKKSRDTSSQGKRRTNTRPQSGKPRGVGSFPAM
jgi:hypothetical protein